MEKLVIRFGNFRSSPVTILPWILASALLEKFNYQGGLTINSMNRIFLWFIMRYFLLKELHLCCKVPSHVKYDISFVFELQASRIASYNPTKVEVIAVALNSSTANNQQSSYRKQLDRGEHIIS